MRLIITIILFFFIQTISAQYFVTTWKTDNPGASSITSITIPIEPTETYNYDVDWDNDGTFDELGITTSVTHDFITAGTYTIRIRGTFPRIYFNNTGDKAKILSVDQWGDGQWTSMAQAFMGCLNLEVNASDIPDFSLTTDLTEMFYEGQSLNQDISGWNVSTITNMTGLFHGASIFNQNISGWDVSNVTIMTKLFSGATAFNQPIGIWVVDDVEDMKEMFYAARSFNQDITGWNVGNVTDMSTMFGATDEFNQPVGIWNVIKVKRMASMFANALVFNQDISGWNVSSVTDMNRMFSGAIAFNQAIENWDVGSVTNMMFMFASAFSFDQPIGAWNVGSVTNIGGMFYQAKLSAVNYDALLNGWNAQVLKPNLAFSGGNSTYCNAEPARSNIISTDGWTITDGGLSCGVSVTDFVTTWKTDNPGSSSVTSITIPTEATETYNYDVDWDNDGTFDEFGITTAVTHDFITAGTYTIRIRGTFPHIYFNNTGDKAKILSVDQWGSGQWTSMNSAFFGCVNLEVNASDAPNLSMSIDLSQMFYGATSFDQDISGWDVSTITNMSSMFFGATLFNQDISSWNVGNVTDMNSMFRRAIAFNKPIEKWNVGSVIDMSTMFYATEAFNQPIEAWNVSKVTNMADMFRDTEAFNQPINEWDVSSVTDMSSMFALTKAFNQDLSGWNTSAVLDMGGMFTFSEAFNQNINTWNVGLVKDMANMFAYSSFNSLIGNWNTESVTDMSGMFNESNVFNQDISGWDVSNVTDMEFMFSSTRDFNQDLSGWNTGAVTNMNSMFRSSRAFNQDIGGWDVGLVVNMIRMFESANVFNQDIGAWNVTSVKYMTNMFNNVTLSVVNYDALLNGWNTQVLQPNVVFSGGNSIYCSAEAARSNIISADGWTITDGGSCITIPACAVLNSPSNGATDVLVDSDLSWLSVAEATGYSINIGTISGATDVVNGEDVGNVLDYNPTTDFLSNTTYYVTITAYNSAGDATGCTETSFTTETLIPACAVLNSPSNGATAVLVGSNLSWLSVAEATGYSINMGTSSGATDVVNGEDVGSVLTYNPMTDFLSNTTYYVSVTAYNSAGDATGCTETSFTTETLIPTCAVLNSPSNGATAVLVGSDLSWLSVAEATGYSINIGTSSGATDVVNGEDVGNVLTYNPTTDFLSNTTYYVTITAYNSAGDATGCTETSFTTETLIPACVVLNSPSNGATAVLVGSDLSWLSVAEATGYSINIGTSSGGSDVVNGEDVGNVLDYNPTTDFLSNTTYYVTITAYNNAGDATGCTETSFTTETLIPACAVLNSPSNGATTVLVGSNLSWLSVAEATGYSISIGTSSGGSDVVNGEDVGNVLDYNPTTDFLSNTTYYVTITAYNNAGDATGCTETSFTTETLIPACAVLNSPSNGATTVLVGSNLSWLSVAEATGYSINIGTSSDGSDVVNGEDVGNVLDYYPTTDFLSNTTYYVTITAYNNAGDATGCTETSFTTAPKNEIKQGFSPDGDGINEYWEIEGIELHPDNTVTIYNRWGDLVFQINGYDNALRVFRGIANKKKALGADSLPSGTYFFDIQIKGEHNFKKLKGFLILKR